LGREARRERAERERRRHCLPGSAAVLRHRGPLRLLWRIVLRGGSGKAPQNHDCCGVAARLGGDLSSRERPDFRSPAVERARTSIPYSNPEYRALLEATDFTGLRKAGMPEE